MEKTKTYVIDDEIKYIDLSDIKFDFYGLTKEEFDKLSKNELIDLEVSNIVKKINTQSIKFNTYFKHFISVSLLAIIALFMFPYFVCVPLAAVSIVFLILMNTSIKKRKENINTWYFGNMFYEHFGIANETNRNIIYNKYRIKGLYDEYIDVINNIINRF